MFALNTSAAVNTTSMVSEQATKQQNVKSVTRKDYGNGVYTITTVYTNGRKHVVWYRPCPNCHGTKVCQLCHGLRKCAMCQGNGVIVGAGYGTVILCVSCHQTGRCDFCKGSGICPCNNGVAISTTQIFDANGNQIYRDHEDYGAGERNATRSNRTNDSKSSCAYCHGTGVCSRPTTARPRSEMIAHYNMSGQKCPYCNWVRAHWHDKCLH